MKLRMNILLLVLLGIVVIVLVYLVVKLDKSTKNDWKKIVKDKLASIDRRVDHANADGLKSLLVEIDSVVDYCLKQKGRHGSTMGERLKDARMLFDREEYNRLWEAHKTRNRLVHEVDFHMHTNEMRKEIGVLRNAVMKLVR